MKDNIIVRPIAFSDDVVLANIIRSSLEEFKANKAGTVYFDDTTDHLTKHFVVNRSAYFVAELNEKVVGGSGIYPTNRLPDDTCELVKLYLSPVAREKGIGKLLIETCIKTAINNNFKTINWETRLR